MSSTASASVRLRPAPAWAPKWWTPRKWPETDGRWLSEFGAAFLHVSKGKEAGGALVLTPWQRWLVEWLLERRPDGRLRHRRSLIGLPRKNGKSLLGSLLAINALIEGEPGAEVYSAAGDRQQARIVFGEAKWQIQQSPALSGVCKTYRDAIEVPGEHKVYRVLSADAKLQQGLNPSMVIFDEVHVQPNDDLWDALTLGSGTRLDPLVVGITTAGHDLDSLCGRLYLYGQRVAAGEVADDSFGFAWWEAPEGCDVHDQAAWAQANPNLSLGLLDIEDMASSAQQTSELAFRRYRLNQWTRTGECWLPSGAWEACTDATLGLAEGAETWVGVDMALKHDNVAVVAVQRHESGRYVVRARVWKPDGTTIDVAAVKQHLRDLHQRFRLVEVTYDPAYFTADAQDLADDGLPMVEFPQSATRMVPACQTAYQLIADCDVAHDGDPVLTDHVLSAEARASGEGWRLSKGKASRKIDACIAMVMALARAHARAEAEFTPAVYVLDDF